MSTRRRIVQACLAAIPVAIVVGSPVAALAQAKLKVAAVYTVPYEQQWVSRIHNALKAAEARGEIEYKSSEKPATYCKNRPPNTAIGETKITENGNIQLSYNATRNK